MQVSIWMRGFEEDGCNREHTRDLACQSDDTGSFIIIASLEVKDPTSVMHEVLCASGTLICTWQCAPFKLDNILKDLVEKE